MGKRAWLKVIAQNRKVIFELAREGTSLYLASRKKSRENRGSMSASTNAAHVQETSGEKL